MNILSTSEGLTVFNGSAYRQIEKQEDKKWEFLWTALILTNERLSRKRNVFTKQSQKVSCRIQNLKKHSRKFQVNQKYKHTTKRNKKNKLNASAIHPLSVGVACCPQTQRGEEMEEKVNEKVIIISAKDLIKEKCIISYIESLTAEDMVSLCRQFSHISI